MPRRREKEMKKLRNNEATNDEDSFTPLPDDLLVLILSKLEDLKDLCVCSLVCKRLASMATHIQTINLTCPVREFTSSTNPNMNFITFLEKFKELESIYLEFTCPRNNASGVNWIAKCKTKTGIMDSFDSFVCQLLDSALETTRDQLDEEEQENQEQHHFHSGFIMQCADHGLNVFFSCFDCVYLLSILVQRLCSLKRVTITDSEKQWKWILEDELLDMWRKSLVSKHLLGLSFVNLSWSWVAKQNEQQGHEMRRRLLKIVVQPEDVGERDVKYELGF